MLQRTFFPSISFCPNRSFDTDRIEREVALIEAQGKESPSGGGSHSRAMKQHPRPTFAVVVTSSVMIVVSVNAWGFSSGGKP